jgi:hypothetical protein
MSRVLVESNVLVDTHPAVAGIPLITRDASRFRTYFPMLEVLAPD